jgi:hypothetical protein
MGGRDFRRPPPAIGQQGIGGEATAPQHLNTSMAEPPLNNSMQRITTDHQIGQTLLT